MPVIRSCAKLHKLLAKRKRNEITHPVFGVRIKILYLEEI
jgi:hypothetical protein